MKTTTKVFLLILLSTAGFAQPRVHIGITSGFNSTYVLDKGLNENPQYIAQANFKWAPIGGSLGIDLTRRFGFQFESIQAAQGQIYQMIQTTQNINRMIAERNIDLKYLQLPLLMKFMSGSDKAARFNFHLGPQLSLLNSGAETIKFIEDGSFNFVQGGDIPIDLTTVVVQNQTDIPPSYQEAINSGQLTPPSENPMEIPLEYFQNPENPEMYDLPRDAVMTLMNSEGQSKIQQFKDKEVQLAFGFGMDIDVIRHFYISANIRANYSFTDMRNQDLINFIGDEDISGILNQRANLLIGAQIGLHWILGGNRSYRAKKKASENEEVFR